MKSESKGTVRSRTLPRLFSPTAVGTLGLLFTPAVGAYFSRENWRELGNEVEARRQGRWCAAGIALLVAMIAGAAANLSSLEGVAQVASLVQVVVWFLRTQSRQIAYVKVHVGKDFERRSLVLPALMASLVFGAALVWYTGRALEQANTLLDTLGIEAPMPGKSP